MRNHLALSLASICILLGNACAAETPQQTAQPQAEYRPTATVRELMDSIIDPSADVVWDSVAVLYSPTGVEEKQPRTPAEWAEVRRGAIRLIEASNLLMIPGRQIANPGETAADPQSELRPEKIQALVNADRAKWVEHSRKLHDAGMEMLQAIDMKNAEGVLELGERIYNACEDCHMQYWYPQDAAAQNAAQ
jgi:hypothetical protein